LIGRSIETLPFSANQRIALELSIANREYRSADDATVPCYFCGVVRDPRILEQPVAIAVAVNGRVQAVTRTCQIQGLYNYWEALISEEALQIGQNDVQFYSIRTTESGYTICRCECTWKDVPTNRAKN
jgi:hypothetical protein